MLGLCSNCAGEPENTNNDCEHVMIVTLNYALAYLHAVEWLEKPMQARRRQ